MRLPTFWVSSAFHLPPQTDCWSAPERSSTVPVFTFTTLNVLWDGIIVDAVLMSVVGMMKVGSPRGALKQ